MTRHIHFVLFLLSALLSACGGGGSSPYVPSTPVSCSLPLQYANGSSSGYFISTDTASVSRSLNACDFSQWVSATLRVCTDHPALSELSGQLQQSGSTVFSFQAINGTPQASSCLSNSGNATSLRSFTITPSNATSLSRLTGDWRVVLTDSAPDNNQSGYFIAWALDIQGLR